MGSKIDHLSPTTGDLSNYPGRFVQKSRKISPQFYNSGRLVQKAKRYFKGATVCIFFPAIGKLGIVEYYLKSALRAHTPSQNF